MLLTVLVLLRLLLLLLALRLLEVYPTPWIMLLFRLLL